MPCERPPCSPAWSCLRPLPATPHPLYVSLHAMWCPPPAGAPLVTHPPPQRPVPNQGGGFGELWGGKQVGGQRGPHSPRDVLVPGTHAPKTQRDTVLLNRTRLGQTGWGQSLHVPVVTAGGALTGRWHSPPWNRSGCDVHQDSDPHPKYVTRVEVWDFRSL